MLTPSLGKYRLRLGQQLDLSSIKLTRMGESQARDIAAFILGLMASPHVPSVHFKGVC